MTKLRLNPRLLGLEWARVELPTPKGMVTVEERRGEAPSITAPRDIEIIIE